MRRYIFRQYLKIAKKVLAIVLVSGVITGLGLGALLIGVSEIIDAHSSTGWPSTTGIVLRSQVLISEHTTSRSNQTSQTDEYYSPDIAYRYVINGDTYRNDNIRYGLATNKPDAEELVRQYPVGNTAEVFYDPDDPKKSVLQPGYFGGLAFFPIMGLIATLFGLFAGWFLWGIET